jgi:hypothetical protein
MVEAPRHRRSGTDAAKTADTERPEVKQAKAFLGQ